MWKFLSAEWRSIVMVNYEIDPEILVPHLPPQTELDFWHGKTFVSMVGFLFLRTRVLRLPVPFHRNFEEVNLRFYARRKTANGWQRGVAFLKEIVPRTAIALTARLLYREKYVSRPMKHQIDSNRIRYFWKTNNRWNTLSVNTTLETPVLPAAGSEEQFIAEHYWGYSPNGKEYKTEHPSWRIQQVTNVQLDCDVERNYGREFVEPLYRRFSSAFCAEGSPVAVYSGSRPTLLL
jgi:uncharacterized protein YqjF (DUF2071 family)